MPCKLVLLKSASDWGRYREYGTFDYIIVGAGSAGAVIANRLSEIAEWRILVLEAGGEETDFSDIPGEMPYLQQSDMNWGYNSTPQTTACLGMVNRQCPFPRGRVLGGTSTINALMYVRGNRRDFDVWGEDSEGWSYKDVLPYFIKSENANIDGDIGYHGVGGLWNVEYHRPYSPQFHAFIEGNKELGRDYVDYNGRQQLGVSRTQLSNLFGRRDSTGKSFINTARKRKNLTILTKSLVLKVLMNNEEAFGVSFVRNNQNYRAIARKEVILSAGSLNSPQLLMLSGIGPNEELTKHNIPVIIDLPVGQTMHDHPTLYGIFHTTNYTEPVKTLRENVEGYLNDYGTLSIAGNSQGIGFFRSNLTHVPDYPPDFPDIEIIFIPSNSTSDIIQEIYHLTDETYNAIFSPINTQTSFTTYIMLLHPRARGTVTLQSASPFDYPIIDPRFLADDFDVETMYAGIQIVLEMARTEAFQKLNTSLLYAPLPACNEFEYLSKDYWVCYMRHLTFNIYHPMGTCRMGPDPNNGAVVDNRSRVHGIKNLRVADASIIPFFLSGHPNAPCVMIGERVSDLIKEDAGLF